jgi:hypothetical protein
MVTDRAAADPQFVTKKMKRGPGIRHAGDMARPGVIKKFGPQGNTG